MQYLRVLSKFIPQQINSQTETTVEIVYNSINDVKCALEDAGMPLKQIEQLESLLPVDDIIDVEAEEVSETGAETSDA